MISLKKYLYHPSADANGSAGPNGALVTSLASVYKSAILAIGNASLRSNPNFGPALQAKLIKIQDKFTADISAAGAVEADRSLVKELTEWGDRTASYFQKKVEDVREILLLMNRYAEKACERDSAHVTSLKALSGKLLSIADLDDLTSIRQSICQGALELQSCVDRMAGDGDALVTGLRSELGEYQLRLAEMERVAFVDVLTGLDNRRGIEQKAELLIERRTPFCIALFDLNGFKQINDTYGHLAGDDILKQFSGELRSQFGTGKSVGRWGGDEFLVIFDETMEKTDAAIQKASGWLFGEYRIEAGGKSAKVEVAAATGLAEWNRMESLPELLRRADKNMYGKKAGRSR